MGKIRVIGEAVPHIKENKHFKMRFLVKLVKPKSFNNQFIEHFIDMGFEVMKIGWRSLDVLLPFDWICLENKDDQTICDNQGRVRLIIYTKKREIQFITRFSYFINHKIDDTGRNIFECHIVDYGNVTQPILIDSAFVDNTIIDCKNNPEMMLMAYHKYCIDYMVRKLPLWQTPTMYWDLAKV